MLLLLHLVVLLGANSVLAGAGTSQNGAALVKSFKGTSGTPLAHRALSSTEKQRQKLERVLLKKERRERKEQKEQARRGKLQRKLRQESAVKWKALLGERSRRQALVSLDGATQQKEKLLERLLLQGAKVLKETQRVGPALTWQSLVQLAVNLDPSRESKSATKKLQDGKEQTKNPPEKTSKETATGTKSAEVLHKPTNSPMNSATSSAMNSAVLVKPAAKDQQLPVPKTEAAGSQQSLASERAAKVLVHDSGMTSAAEAPEPDARSINRLIAPEEPISESIDLSSLVPVSLNPLEHFTFMANRAEMTCVEGQRGLASLASLPKCPDFTPCAATLTSIKTEGGAGGVHAARPPKKKLIPQGSLAVCSSGLQDEERLQWPKPPRNCRAWYTMSAQRKSRLLLGYLRRGEMDTSAAESRFLVKNPRVGCGHKTDFYPTNPVAYPVYAIKRAYVGGDSIMFTRSTLFLRSGCQDDLSHYKPDLCFVKGNTTVKRVAGEVMNWLYRPGNNFYHTLVESFPLFLAMAPFMRRNPDLHLLGLQYQFDMYQKLLEPLVGVPLQSIRRYEVQQKDLVLTELAYQPVYQPCGKQSKGLWTELRRRHLLHPNGIPMFNQDWTPRVTRPLSASQVRRYPRNWVVVLGVRPEGAERHMPQTDEILKALEEQFGRKRVVTFLGNASILEAQALFRRARLFVAAHGAALANMIFMPAGSSVLEIRPTDYPNPCYHSLADACSLEYNLVLGRGAKEGDLLVEGADIMDAISSTAEKLTARGRAK